jgi:hypothetical protein
LDIFDIPKATIELLSKEVNDPGLLNKFCANRETEMGNCLSHVTRIP